jgi:Ras-related protein Rab-1A
MYKIINTDKYDLIGKIIIIGDKNVGKTSFLKKYLLDQYDNNYISTIGPDVKNFAISNNKNTIKLQVWDTPGDNKYRKCISNFYKGIMGIIIMFDITDFDSFINIRSWVEEINKYKYDNINIILVGNKIDKDDKFHEIKDNIALSLAEELECPYIKISVKNNFNLDRVFSELFITK